MLSTTNIFVLPWRAPASPISHRTPPTHARHVTPIRKNFLKESLRDELMFLGRIVSADGIKPNPCKIAAVQEWPSPTDVNRSALLPWTCYLIQTVCARFSRYGSSCNRVASLGACFCSRHYLPTIFFEGKGLATHATVLAVPDFEQPFGVWCNASSTVNSR